MARRKTYKMVLPETLRSEEGIRLWADRYPESERCKDDWLRNILQSALEQKQCLDREELRYLDIWKTNYGRVEHHLQNNERDTIRRRTREAYYTKRIEPLMTLKGLQQFPMASSLMHFICPDHFPVIDKRALWTLLNRQQDAGSNRGLWEAYVKKCLDIRKDYGTPLRTIDRALWQYGGEVYWWEEYAEKPHPLLDRAL